MTETTPSGSIHIGGDVGSSTLVAGSHNIVIGRAEQVMLQAAAQAQAQRQDPARMLRILALLAAPVLDPHRPDHPPPPLDLRREWRKLADEVRGSKAPILLARLAPPTPEALRSALSPRAGEQGLLPHVLHFSGHARRDGLLLEDEFGRTRFVAADELTAALGGLPRPLDLAVLNGCESAADLHSAAQALLEAGLARAVVGHTRPVLDAEAVAFAARLYAELTDGFPLDEAVARAQRCITTHDVVLLGQEDLRFTDLRRGEPVVDDARPPGNLPARFGLLFLGRGRELVRLARRLARPPVIALITGPAGIGKSSLLLEAAHRNAHRFPGGVAYAEALSGGYDALLTRLAAGLGLEPQPGRMEGALLAHAVQQPTLLLLDNLETLPPPDLDRLARFLGRLGGGSAAIAALRPPCRALEDLPTAVSIPLHDGLALQEAAHYVRVLAEERGVPLAGVHPLSIARAAGGHPRLLELLVAQARRRDLNTLLAEVRELRGDFTAQLDKVYDWHAARLEETGQGTAWRSLLLFPADNAPEALLWAAVGREGAEALRAAALADFDPQLQLWRWHGTVAEYARARRPWDEEERLARLAELLPAWAEWLAGLRAGEREARIEACLPNLEAALEAARRAGGEAARPFVEALEAALPPPDRTLALREVQESLYRTGAALAPDEAARAGSLHNLGNVLSELGRREEALAATEEAVGLFRRLAEGQPAAFLPDLAGSLNNLGNRLAALGRREEALAAAEEAVALYRRLAEKQPAAFRPELATSLTGLGAMLADLGRREEALAAAEEAVAICRRLAEGQPAAFLPDLAMSLNNLGNRLADLGRREEALAAAEEAVGLYRRLAEKQPAAFLPELAGSLNNLGAMLAALGRREEALAATEEAVGLYRRLAEKQPAAFRPDLARSLNNLGARLADLGRREEALAATEEAVAIRRRLAARQPAAFRPDLARSLNNLGMMLAALGRREEALAATEEAVGLYRRLAEKQPAAFLPDLAGSLNNLGAMLADLGRREEALAAAEEAVGLYRRLAEDRPAAFLPDLAMSLNNLGAMLSDLGRREEALAAAEEAVGLYRRLAEGQPAAFLPDLAASLTGLGNRLAALGRREEALAAAEEAVGLYRRLAEKQPAAFLPDLAGSLHNLGAMLADLGRREEALAAAEEAVAIRRRLAEDRPAAFLPDLAGSLHNLGAMLADLGRREEALAAAEEAVRTLLPFYRQFPAAFADWMKTMAGNYLAACSSAGRQPDEELLGALGAVPE